MGLKAHGGWVDRSLVSVTHPTPIDGIDGILAELPRNWVIGHQGDARLVMGPSGAFVLVPGQADVAAAADLAQSLAHRTRAVVSHHISWVPFIDAAVVTDADRPAEVAAVVVPVDLLGELLIEGPPVIDRPALGVLRNLLVQGDLDGWQVGSALADVSIDLCESRPDPATRAHI
ncbi:MAG TPA: hypothetical protein VMT43_02860, partial [Acidimicrobiales bacterium]|nr:hypothetical protein [Acidimicrobiales bacterium]